jgi:hypothetical protein
VSYLIERFFFDRPGRRRIIRRGLTLEQAQSHCQNPETSSTTCKGAAGKRRTRECGRWFDGYTEE